ncbi:CL2D3 protein, partial [Pitta sordida]|nr:CL2D3 protein [Pitta sordida]
WDHFQGQCYYFSKDEANWTTSLESCRALGASLAILRTEEELGFALRCESRRNYWIGLEQRDNGWWWIDGTAFDPGFEVRADNSCGVLNHLGIGPSFCRTQKSWICSRPDNSVLWKE